MPSLPCSLPAPMSRWTPPSRSTSPRRPAGRRTRCWPSGTSAERPFAVLAPGGLSSTRWPAERFAALAAAVAGESGLAVLLEGSAEEAPLLREIAGAAGHPSVLACPDPLALFPAVLARARLLIANDSAPLHFAAALGVPALYFAQREKLVHSHPGGADCWALYDDLENDPAHITVADRRSARCAR